MRTKNILLLILFILSFLIRIYKINDYLFFGFEQGRDALAIKNIYQLKDFVLVGPKTDIGGIFHGAWYYYLLAPIYLLGKGNPLFAIYFLITLNSLIPVVVYLILEKMGNKKTWCLVGGLLSAISFELISYSRWLSNVNPSGLLVALSFLYVWKYKKSERDFDFLLTTFFASLASQFEIILLLWFGWVFGLLLTTKFLKVPKIKAWLKAISLSLFLFLPMIVFNVRNDFISFKSLGGGDSHGEIVAFNLNTSLIKYYHMMVDLMKKNIANYDGAIFIVIGILFFIGVILTMMRDRIKTVFFLFWIFMSLPVLMFTGTIDKLPQIYVGTGIGLILLFTLVLRSYWDKRLGKLLVFFVGFLVIYNLARNINYLENNDKVFYRTIQDDLNYKDQKGLLTYIHNGSNNEEHRIKSFTIPYYQEEGWQYLQSYYFPSDKIENDSNLIYLIIEEKVDPYWQEIWTEELGETKLLEEKMFGKIMLEKRIKVN